MKSMTLPWKALRIRVIGVGGIALAVPLVDLLVGSLLLWAALHWNEPSMAKRPFGDGTPAKVPWMPQSHVIAWLAFAALMNLILFVGELIPATVGKLTTDGGHLLN